MPCRLHNPLIARMMRRKSLSSLFSFMSFFFHIFFLSRLFSFASFFVCLFLRLISRSFFLIIFLSARVSSLSTHWLLCLHLHLFHYVIWFWPSVRIHTDFFLQNTAEESHYFQACFYHNKAKNCCSVSRLILWIVNKP